MSTDDFGRLYDAKGRASLPHVRAVTVEHESIAGVFEEPVRIRYSAVSLAAEP
jgi:hypothetical protein